MTRIHIVHHNGTDTVWLSSHGALHRRRGRRRTWRTWVRSVAQALMPVVGLLALLAFVLSMLFLVWVLDLVLRAVLG